MLTMFFKRDLC